MSNSDIILSEVAQKEKLLVFAGSGVSDPTGIPTWRKLLENLQLTYRIPGVNVEDIDSNNFPEIAQMFYRHFEENDCLSQYHDILKNNLRALKISHTPLQQQIIYIGFNNNVVTTNFDTTFEDTFSHLNVYGNTELTCDFQSIPSLSADNINKKKGLITYLHGRIESNEIIFTLLDYEKHYKNSHAMKELYYDLYTNYTLLFIGFSFEDRYVKQVLYDVKSQILEKIKNSELPTNYLSEIKHYVIISEKFKIPEKICNDLKLSPIYYPNENHIVIESYLKTIYNSRKSLIRGSMQ